MFATPEVAKQFFVDRIIRQAESERSPLSKNQALMLKWSEVNRPADWTPEFMIKLAEDFGQECDDSDYEAKVSELLRRAYEADIKAQPSAAEQYQSAYDAFSDQDHYILIMIGKALGGDLRQKRRKFFGIF